MKARAEVSVIIKHIYEFDVDQAGSDGWSQAHTAAYDKAKQEHEGSCVSVNNIQLIEGPLVASVKWNNHHVFDVIIARAAFGYRIPEKECKYIQLRLESLGLKVVDRWNVGSHTVSFRAKGRDGHKDFTHKQEKFLCGEIRVENLTADELKEAIYER